MKVAGFGKIYTPDDKGETWQLKKEAVFAHASLFRDGDKVYLLGGRGAG